MPGRVLAAVYDKMNAGPEAAGVAALRAELLATARGATLEVGAGTGLNLEHYPVAVSRLVITEPEPHMRTRLEEKVRRSGRRAELRADPVEALAFPDDTFDTIVCTMLLCTVADPAVALAELGRVLAPGGRLLVLEHVRSERPRVARLQDAVRPLYAIIGRGCHPNRDTLANIRAAGFEVGAHRREIAPKTPSTENELLVGEASWGRPAAAQAPSV